LKIKFTIPLFAFTVFGVFTKENLKLKPVVEVNISIVMAD